MRTIVLFLILLSPFVKAQITFNKTYDCGIDGSSNILELTDGYLSVTLAGFPIYPGYINIIKTDFNGDTIWEKKYGDSTEYYLPYSLIKTSDGNFLSGSYLYNFITKKRYCFLIKFDNNGDTLWLNKIMSTPGFNFYCQYLIETSDKGFLITGQIADTASTDANVLLLKTDSIGNFLWQQVLGGIKYDLAFSSVELPDKGFLSLGYTRSFGFGNSTNHDFYLIRSDSLGNFISQNTYGTILDEEGRGIKSLSDGNFLLAGYAQTSNSPYYARGQIVKIDSSGNVIWQNKYGKVNTSSELWWARELPNHNIVAVGATENPSTFIDDGWIILLDVNGNLLWDRNFEMNNNYAYFRNVQPTTDGGFICAGFCFTGASGNQDAWLVKLDSLGCDSAGCPTYYTGILAPPFPVGEGLGVRIYPNPVTDVIYVSLIENRKADSFEISLFNIQGTEVIRRNFVNTGNAHPMYIRNLAKGLYLLRCEVGGNVFSKKIVKE